MNKNREKIVRELREELIRLTNKMRILEKKSMDFGTGEALHTFEIHVIDAIGRGAGQTVTELAGWFTVTKGAVSQVAGKLTRTGYVIKERNPENGKEVLLSLTPKGEIVLAGHEEFHRGFDREMLEEFANLTNGQLMELQGIMARMTKHVDRYVALPESFKYKISQKP